jgi:predicted regulator of Ras-like GTPase activity (Roadblock/LC7/MglB family)
MRDTLNTILQSVDGALAAIIMAYDGIPIDEAAVEQTDFDTQLLSVEYANVLKEIKRAVNVIKSGDMEEVSITTSQTLVVMRVLNDQLFIALILRRGGDIGKGRYLLRIKSYELIRELE